MTLTDVSTTCNISGTYTDLDKTRATSLWLTWQLNGRNQVLRQRFQQQQQQLQPGLYWTQHLQKLWTERYKHQATPVATATTPYIKGTYETIARILEPYNIRVAHKPITTLRQLLTNVKDKDEPSDRQGAVNKIKCCDCQPIYVGETGRNLKHPTDWT